jgi:hypothetical protein
MGLFSKKINKAKEDQSKYIQSIVDRAWAQIDKMSETELLRYIAYRSFLGSGNYEREIQRMKEVQE